MSKKTANANAQPEAVPAEGAEGSAPNNASAPESEIAKLAYQYWQQRGCAGGCSEDDWYRAERELTSRMLNH